MSYLVVSVDAARSVLGNARCMGFIELKPFTRAVNYLMSDENYRQLQNALIEDPERGAVIIGTGGLRKLRWASSNTGESGGLRVIYSPIPDPGSRGKYWCCLMLIVFPKSEQEDLTASQKKTLAKRMPSIIEDAEKFRLHNHPSQPSTLRQS